MRRRRAGASDFGRTGATEQGRAVISNGASNDFERKVVSGPRIQCLRSIMLHSAVATERTSIGFDRTVATEEARAVISSAQWLLSKLEQ